MDLPPDQKIEKDYRAMKKIAEAIKKTIVKIGDFKILDDRLAPEGLKPLARSVGWLVEQILVQNLRKYKDEFEIEKVENPPSNVSLYDCAITFKGQSKKYYLNIKTSSFDAKLTKDDISKADKLIELYESDPDFTLFIAVVKVKFKNTLLIMDHEENLIMFNVAWIPDIYCNPRNNNLQSSKYSSISFRTNKSFLEEMKKQYEVSKVKKRGNI